MARKRINDFGGNNAAGNSKRSMLLTGHNLISMRCLSCNKLNYLGFRETQRAAAPRCNACGGGLSEIEASHKRRTGCSYKKAEKIAAVNLGAKPFSCDTCKTKFRSAVALSMHVKEKHPKGTTMTKTSADTITAAAAALAAAVRRESELEDNRTAVKMSAIERIMKRGDNPLTGKPHSFSSAEALVNTDIPYSDYLGQCRDAAHDRIIARGNYDAALALARLQAIGAE
jgi:hypothetical protein